jgi:hypothetical protein
LAVKPLHGLSCECAAPAFADPVFDPVLAPYREVDGCISPRRLVDLYTITREVHVALFKPDNMKRALNLTLQMQGDDPERPAYWSIANAGNLPSWLKLPLSSGPADGDSLPIALILGIAGLRERAAPYEAILQVNVTSAVAAVASMVHFPFSLTVQVRTRFAVWGQVGEYDICVVNQPPVKAIRKLDKNVVYFTACDEVCVVTALREPSPLAGNSLSTQTTLVSKRSGWASSGPLAP